jgi:hypothetical protein
MRAFRIITATAVVAAFILGFLSLLSWLLTPEYIALQHKSAKYYAELAVACDFTLAKHPSGTNEAIWIPVTDPSLPKIIRNLHPIKLQVNAQRVWMLLGSDTRAGIGLAWQRKRDDTNVWVLEIVAESLETDLYSAKRSMPPNTAPKPPPAGNLRSSR